MGAIFTKMSRGNGYFNERNFKENDLKHADTVFIDLRTEEEYLHNHLRTAIHLPLPQAGANKSQLEVIFANSGIQELLLHYHVREDPVCLVLYASQSSYFMQDTPRLLYYHKEFFSSFSHQLSILTEGFSNIKANPETYFSSSAYREQTNNAPPPSNDPTLIRENLFLASLENVKNSEFLENENIQVIINTSRVMYDPPKGVKYVQIAIEPTEGEIRFIELLQTLYDIIEEHLLADCKVVIFSGDDKVQAPTVALYYLMRKEKWMLYKAFKHITQTGREILPPIVHIRFLLELESVSFPNTAPSIPLRLYILHYLNHEPLEDSMKFLNYETEQLQLHSSSSGLLSGPDFLENFDFDETTLSSPLG